jgi:hypothetical protein
MKLNIESMEKADKEGTLCKVKPLKTVEGKYKVLICENIKTNKKNE